MTRFSWKQLVIVILAGILFGIGISLLLYHQYYLLEYREMNVDFNVWPGVGGLNADKDALHMGGIPPGGGSARWLTIIPAHDTRLVIALTGNASLYVFPDKNNFFVRKDENVTIEFDGQVPTDAALGNYTGKVKFYFYRR